MIIEILKREAVYLWYYFTLITEQIAPYWIMGVLLGSFISVFAKKQIHQLFVALQFKRLGAFGVVPASILGILSPLCMYGTIPVAASFSEKGVEDDWLAAFMMSSILLNPQLIIYTAALGQRALIVRIVACLLCGIIAGLLIRFFYRGRRFFDFTGFYAEHNRDTDPNILRRFLKNIWRNITATGLYFLLGIILSVLFQRYVSADFIVELFGKQNGLGILMAATIGVPLYLCGGGTIPLLMDWLANGMSMGSAATFMITGPATKITNLGAVKIILGLKNFVVYLLFVCTFSIIIGLSVNLFL